MNQTENQWILSFDMLYTNNHIQILKLLLPCFEPETQKKLAVMIKYLELEYTVAYFRQNPDLPGAVCSDQTLMKGTNSQEDIVEIFSRIRSFCTPTERAMFDQLSTFKKNMEKYEEIMRIMQVFSDFSGLKEELSAPETTDSVNPMEFLKNMLTEEQQSMFDLFSAAFNQDPITQ